MKIVEVFAQGGQVAGNEWLARAESVHRQLRPHLPDDYPAKMTRVLKDARMALAVKGDTVLGLGCLPLARKHLRWLEVLRRRPCYR
jgi:hypothetical protein